MNESHNGDVLRHQAIEMLPTEFKRKKIHPNDGQKFPSTEEDTGYLLYYVEMIQTAAHNWVEENAQILRIIAIATIFIAYHVFLIFAVLHNAEKTKILIIITMLVWVCCIYFWFIVPLFFKPYFRSIITSISELLENIWKRYTVRISFYGAIIIGISIFLIIDTKNSRHRLMGLLGMITLTLFMFIFSKHPSKVNWRPVLGGFFFQFCVGLLVLRSDLIMETFSAISVFIIGILQYAKNGTDFVYGFLSSPPNICGIEPVFAFRQIQVVVYFGSIVTLLYYIGVLQWILKKMAWILQITLGTTAPESLNACGSIFLGEFEAPLLIYPYLECMTASELHAVMTTGFSCIAGTLFATYINFGACSSYLLSSALMSAPCSLACSKLMYPETETSQKATSALESISNGAVMAVDIVFAVLANIIVFIALLAFFDSIISYFGDLVGHPEWSFQLLLGYIFYPLAFVIGVDVNELLHVSQLIGTKTAVNEFVAYKRLSELITENQLSARSAMIATYALCGFSNFTSVGIQLGILGGLAPSRKRLLSQLAIRALLAGSISCFMTASLAGLLIENPIICPVQNSTECFNISTAQTVLKHLSNATVSTIAPMILEKSEL